MRVWKEYALRIGRICRDAMKRRLLKRLRLAVNMELERKGVERVKVEEVVRRRKSEVLRKWRRVYLADAFKSCEGEWLKVRGALGVLRRRGVAFREKREEMDKWLRTSEARGGVSCVASMLWREGLRR